ncbi:Hypothetical predicted protein, partial [Paramuricea clavata]
NKSVGPDYIPNRVVKEFAHELAPIIKDIYNQSMKEGYIPELLKSSIVIPVPKINPPRTIENDLRPISLTCTIAKVMEGFTCTRLLPQLEDKLDPRQYARKNHSTTDALLYTLQAIYEAVDTDWKSVKGGVPQGTKLGVILFIVMTNKLFWEWNLRTKFVDDTSVLEIIPRNSISVLNNAAADIHNFAIEHNMKLN